MRSLFGDAIADAGAEIERVAGFALAPEETAPFAEFIGWLNLRPRFIADWRCDPERELRFYGRFTQGLDACRQGYVAAAYHLGRLREIESAVQAILDRYDFSTLPRGSTAAFGNTARWDFEYQAFVLAYRRSLDGLAWGLSTYFKSEISSFRQFAKVLPKLHPRAVAAALGGACDRHIDSFAFVMGSARGQSVRDRISHREAVQAGVINVGAFGHRIVGGGEGLGLGGMHDRRGLGETLQTRLRALHDAVADILTTFRAAVNSHEGDASVD